MTEKYTWPKIFYAPREKESGHWLGDDVPTLYEKYEHSRMLSGKYRDVEIEWVALRVEFDHIVEGER